MDGLLAGWPLQNSTFPSFYLYIEDKPSEASSGAKAEEFLKVLIMPL